MKLYKTRLIDEVTFYKIKGFECSYKVLKARIAEWTFQRSSKFEEARRQFWGGNPQVFLNKWLVVRQQLKFEQESRFETKDSKKEKLNPLNFMNGETYYYKNDFGHVKSAFYGGAEIHTQRAREGNMYKHVDEAQKHVLK